jgi:hypothetical protein
MSHITDMARAKRIANATADWYPTEPVSAASGSAAAAETTVALPAGVVAPQGATAVLYRLGMTVGGGGKAKVEVRHRAGGGTIGAAEASSAMGCSATSHAFADWNGGRCTYVVTFTSSPTSVSWDISVVGFLRTI